MGQCPSSGVQQLPGAPRLQLTPTADSSGTVMIWLVWQLHQPHGRCAWPHCPAEACKCGEDWQEAQQQLLPLVCGACLLCGGATQSSCHYQGAGYPTCQMQG